MLGAGRIMLTAIAFALALAEPNATRPGRELLSAGCQACCFARDCRLAYTHTSPGICCGQYPRAGCCPMGSSCVSCGSSWRCTRSRFVTAATRRSVCSAGYGYHQPVHHGYGPPVHHGYGPPPHYYLEADQASTILVPHDVLLAAIAAIIAAVVLMLGRVGRRAAAALL